MLFCHQHMLYGCPNTTCMNVDGLIAEATSNIIISVQFNVPPVVTYLQAGKCKCAFVGGLKCRTPVVFNKTAFN